MSTKLWTRHANYYLVEALVGTSWTQIAKIEESKERALDEAALSLADDSVLATRVHEHEIVHVCHEIEAKESAPVVKIPKKMSATGEIGVCRVCYMRTVIAEDGKDKWAFCEGCDRTLPVVV